MTALIYHKIVLLLLFTLTLTLAQVRIPITRKTLPHPALNRRLSSRSSVSASLVNNITQSSYVISVKVGTPPQDIDLIIDTGSSDTWLIANTVECTLEENFDETDPAPCNTPFNPNASSSVKLNVTNDSFNISYLDGSGSVGTYITDNFVLGNATVNALQMGLADSIDGIVTGIFGVGYTINVASNTIYPNIIEDLVSQKLIDTRAYSLYLDSYNSSTGSILFGAVDTSKFIGDLVKIDIVPAPFWNGSVLYSSFDVELDGLGITDQEGNTKNFTSSPKSMTLDSGTSITYLPDTLTRAIFDYFTAYDDTASSSNVYIACSLLTSSPSLTINYLFSESSSSSSSSISTRIKVPLSELIFPLTNPLYALAPGTSIPKLPFSGEACGFGIQTGSDGFYLLGDTFLRSAYVVYDLENNQIGLAQANFEDGDGDASDGDGDGDGNGDGDIVELKAGETNLPSLSGGAVSTGSSESMGAKVTSTSFFGPASTGGGAKTGTGTAVSGKASATTPTDKKGGAISISRNVDLRVLGWVMMGGVIFGGGMI